MAMGVGRGRVCLKIIQYRDPENFLLSASISEISHTQAELLPILSQISLPWQQGSVVVELSNTLHMGFRLTPRSMTLDDLELL